MNTTDVGPIEQALQRAHLLCVRRDFHEAETVLRVVLRRDPSNEEARYMLGRIASTRREEKNESERLRAWRYNLRLQTTWQRVVWGVSGGTGVLYGLWGLGLRLPASLRDRPTAELTSRVYSGSKANPVVDWTRPLYYDLAYYSGFALAGAAMLFVLWMVSRGASQWEELDAPMPENSRYGW